MGTSFPSQIDDHTKKGVIATTTRESAHAQTDKSKYHLLLKVIRYSGYACESDIAT